MCPPSIATLVAEGIQEHSASPVSELSKELLREAQEEDLVLEKVREYVTKGQWPNLKGQPVHEDVRIMAREKKKLCVHYITKVCSLKKEEAKQINQSSLNSVVTTYPV